MIEEKKKKMIMPVVALVIVAVLVIALGSYAYWQITRKQSGRNVVGTACLNISFSESKDINLENQYPMTDEEGSEKTPYTFTIINQCNTPVNYVVGLESIEDNEKSSSDYLSYDYIRVKLDNDSAQTYGSLESLTNDVNQDYTIRDTKEITHHTLGANESVTHNLRLWVDENTPLENGDGTNNSEKYFYGKIKIVAGQNINGDTPVTIAVVNGDINTVGSEVQIGNEHFYVIGDDEEVSGNVKLLAKYNLMVGEYSYYYDTDLLDSGLYGSDFDCEKSGGNMNDKGDCLYHEQFTPSTPGYNLQFPNDKGNDCSVLVETFSVSNILKSDCSSINGSYIEEEQVCVLGYYSGLPQSMCESENFYYDNGFCYPSIAAADYINDGSVSEHYMGYELCNEKSLVDFTDNLNDGNNLNEHYLYYWQNYSSGELLDNYSLTTNQTAPYVYYDNNKNIDLNNKIAPYVNNYKNYLESEFNLTITDTRLMSIEEFNSICPWDSNFRIDEDDTGAFICQGSNFWMFNTTFWLGSANVNFLEQAYYVTPEAGGKLYSDRAADENAGIRPVISVSKNIFN